MSWSIESRNVLVTGGNSGIGRATAVALARLGADVTITTRDPAVGGRVASELTEESGREVRAIQVDLADAASIAASAERYLATANDLGVLINNAGVMLGRRRLSTDGHEMTFRINHLGHFHLTCLLSDLLLASAPSRVVTLASSAHYSAEDIELEPSRGPYRGFRTYSRSKLANVLFAAELARRMEGTGVRSYAVHPGLVATKLGQDGDTLIPNLLWKLFRGRMLTPEQGALTSVFAATDPALDEHSGAYLSDERITEPSEPAGDLDLAARLWDFSEQATGCRIP